MKYYLHSADETLNELRSSENGLSSAEAEKRLAENGHNKLSEGKKTPLIVKFFKQMTDPMTIILLVAAVVSGIISFVEKEVPTDVFIILFVVILNAILGVVQESKADKALSALKEMTAATSKVIRDGKQEVIKSELLTVGDVIVLEAGDAVPADARIIECNSLKCEESALTGESVPTEKRLAVLTPDKNGDVGLGDRANMVYSGSTVVYGRGKAVITATGMNTEMGRIATALQDVKEEKTPLQVKLSQLSKILTKLVIVICVVIFAVGIVRSLIQGNITDVKDFFEHTVLSTFMVAVSLAVAAIPEGLSTVVTIVLSIGVTKMSRRSAVIRKLTAVETLGCTQIICSDKTGTLTQNKMTVVGDYTANKTLCETAMTLCNDAMPDENGVAVGEPTECALVNYATAGGLDKNELLKSSPRVNELPFDSGRKMMSTFHKQGDKIIQYVKGAPDELLRLCTTAVDKNGVCQMTDELRKNILAQNKAMADKALRVLACAYREYDTLPENVSVENNEKDLTFIGLCGMIDPIRPEVKDAIKDCKSAGIRPIMITGDHKDTAVAIAMELDIIKNPSEAITGAELNELSDEQLEKSIDKYSVYARVQPEHKVRIVTAWKKRGMITAMTGDGVNDAPSIKSADIGVGMGITGTDVTKNVADMVLADDNFATIVFAVGEGRRIYDNIRKAIQFLLSSNMSEVLTIFTAQMIGYTVLEAPHLLWINLITDCLPALALGMEPAEKDVMQKPPRSNKDGIFAGGVGVDTLYQGVLVTILTLTAYFLGRFVMFDPACGTAEMQGMTMAFLTMSMAEIFHSYNMRSQRGSIFRLGNHNFFLFGAMILSLVLTTAVIEIPFIARLFNFATIDIAEYAVALGLAVTVIPVVEIVKLIQRKIANKKNK
ncbi:MAG: calcium-translocating P-type ATPase, PMCA-type [Candidatus Borkfalkiaceae bacterium]|nr:calcium-translocating P-type ATPase, PMCA-type [Christensenellaceae bacterium]